MFAGRFTLPLAHFASAAPLIFHIYCITDRCILPNIVDCIQYDNHINIPSSFNFQMQFNDSTCLASADLIHSIL